MARPVRQSRTHTGFAALTGVTQFLELTPSDLPAGSTLTRCVGTFATHSVPDADDSAMRILFVVGLGVTDTPATIDVSNPNTQPAIWLWWNEIAVTMQEQWIDSTTMRQVPTARYIDFDVSGQRQVDVATGKTLHLFARLFGDPLGGSHTVRLSLAEFYLLPA